MNYVVLLSLFSELVGRLGLKAVEKLGITLLSISRVVFYHISKFSKDCNSCHLYRSPQIIVLLENI